MTVAMPQVRGCEQPDVSPCTASPILAAMFLHLAHLTTIGDRTTAWHIPVKVSVLRVNKSTRKFVAVLCLAAGHSGAGQPTATHPEINDLLMYYTHQDFRRKP